MHTGARGSPAAAASPRSRSTVRSPGSRSHCSPRSPARALRNTSGRLRFEPALDIAADPDNLLTPADNSSHLLSPVKLPRNALTESTNVFMARERKASGHGKLLFRDEVPSTARPAERTRLFAQPTAATAPAAERRSKHFDLTGLHKPLDAISSPVPLRLDVSSPARSSYLPPHPTPQPIASGSRSHPALSNLAANAFDDDGIFSAPKSSARRSQSLRTRRATVEPVSSPSIRRTSQDWSAQDDEDALRHGSQLSSLPRTTSVAGRSLFADAMLATSMLGSSPTEPSALDTPSRPRASSISGAGAFLQPLSEARPQLSFEPRDPRFATANGEEDEEESRSFVHRPQFDASPNKRARCTSTPAKLITDSAAASFFEASPFSPALGSRSNMQQIRRNHNGSLIANPMLHGRGSRLAGSPIVPPTSSSPFAARHLPQDDLMDEDESGDENDDSPARKHKIPPIRHLQGLSTVSAPEPHSRFSSLGSSFSISAQSEGGDQPRVRKARPSAAAFVASGFDKRWIRCRPTLAPLATANPIVARVLAKDVAPRAMPDTPHKPLLVNLSPVSARPGPSPLSRGGHEQEGSSSSSSVLSVGGSPSSAVTQSPTLHGRVTGDLPMLGDASPQHKSHLRVRPTLLRRRSSGSVPDSVEHGSSWRDASPAPATPTRSAFDLDAQQLVGSPVTPADTVMAPLPPVATPQHRHQNSLSRSHPPPAGSRPTGNRTSSSSRLHHGKPDDRLKYFPTRFEDVETNIAQGAFGSVHVARSSDGRKWAIKEIGRGEGDGKGRLAKCVTRTTRTDADRWRRQQEVYILRLIQSERPPSPFIIFMQDAWEQIDDAGADTNLFIQTEYYGGGTLDEFLDHYAAEHACELDETRTWKILTELASGIDFLHSLDVVHYDLKPANVFVDDRGSLRIGDFGHATTWPGSLTSGDIMLGAGVSIRTAEYDGVSLAAQPWPWSARRVLAGAETFSHVEVREGDKTYLAPEALQGHFGRHSDIFRCVDERRGSDIGSFGVIMLEVAAMVDVPADGDDRQAIAQDDFSRVDLSHSSDHLVMLIRSMLRADWTQRITADAILRNTIVRPLAELTKPYDQRDQSINVDALWVSELDGRLAGATIEERADSMPELLELAFSLPSATTTSRPPRKSSSTDDPRYDDSALAMSSIDQDDAMDVDI